MTVYVDIPLEDFEEWKNICIFKGPKAKEEAIEYCMERFGADAEGRVSLLMIEPGEEEDEEKE